MSFEAHFLNQLNMHPSMQYQDVIKLCYQASFGAEHILSDISAARTYLERELNSVEPSNEPLAEHISDDVCRINLRAWKKRELPIGELFEAFCNSASVNSNSRDAFFTCLEIAERVMGEKKVDFSLNEWRGFVNSYLQSGLRAIHHSEKYRELEKPSYRIIKINLLKEEWL